MHEVLQDCGTHVSGEYKKGFPLASVKPFSALERPAMRCSFYIKLADTRMSVNRKAWAPGFTLYPVSNNDFCSQVTLIATPRRDDYLH